VGRTTRGVALVVLVAAIAAVAARVAAPSSTALILPTHTPGALHERAEASAAAAMALRRPKPVALEEDHFISLELGGAPYAKKNVWPEPHAQSAKSDPKENAWHSSSAAGR
jgi:hypothetical protein